MVNFDIYSYTVYSLYRMLRSSSLVNLVDLISCKETQCEPRFEIGSGKSWYDPPGQLMTKKHPGRFSRQVHLQPSPIKRKEHDLNHPPPGNYGTQPLIFRKYTLQRTNISPKNGTFEDDFPVPQVGYVNSPKSSFLIGFSIINHPFWGVSLFFWKHPGGYTHTRHFQLLPLPGQSGSPQWRR